MIYHRTDETGHLLQTDLRLVPFDVDRCFLVQGLEAQSVFQVGSFRAPSSSLNLMHCGHLFSHTILIQAFHRKYTLEETAAWQMRMMIYGGNYFLDYFRRCYATPQPILVFRKLLATASVTTNCF